MIATDDDWLSLSDAATILGVHPSTLRAWSDRGDIPCHRTPGMHRRFRRADVEHWAESRREAHASPGQLIAENVLGRTRMQLAEGRLAETTWYRQFDEQRRRELRDTGRSQLRLLVRYLGSEGDAALPETCELGQAYERLGREAGPACHWPRRCGCSCIFATFCTTASSTSTRPRANAPPASGPTCTATSQSSPMRCCWH